MSPQIRIVVRDRGFLAAATPVKPFAAPKAAPSSQPPRSKRGDLAMLRQGVDIALEYFNSDGSVPISTLTTKARNWADRYFKGYPYAAKRPTALLRTFPSLFNLSIEAHLRLVPKVMSPPSSPEPEGARPRDLRRAERQAMNSEAFPEFAEPTLASDSDIDQIVDLRTRRPDTAAKPTMRVDAAMLRGSGLLSSLPEFLGQLARANLETETMLSSDPSAVRIELDDDQAASQQHIEMNLFSGLVEAQRRRRQRGVLLPGDLAVKAPGSSESSSERESSSEQESSSEDEETTAARQQTPSHSTSSEDSGDESDASTSTTASRRANLKKRKAADRDADDEEEEDSGPASPPNKIRLQYHYPPNKLRYFDQKRRKLVTRPNPAAVPDDPFTTLTENNNDNDKSITVATSRPSSSSSSSSSQSSSSGSNDNSRTPMPITKIRVPSRSPDGSRSASPDRVILLRHPVVSHSSSRESSAEPGSGVSSSGSPARRTRIRVVQKNLKGEKEQPRGLEEEGRGKKRRLIEEVE